MRVWVCLFVCVGAGRHTSSVVRTMSDFVRLILPCASRVSASPSRAPTRYARRARGAEDGRLAGPVEAALLRRVRLTASNGPPPA